MDHIVFYLFALVSALGLAGYFFQLAAVRSKFAQTQKKSPALPDAALSPLFLSSSPSKGLMTIFLTIFPASAHQEYPNYESHFCPAGL